MLTIIENLGLLPVGNRKRTFVRAKCHCGTEKVLPKIHVDSGAVQSCGCLRQETGVAHFKQLGQARKQSPGRSEFSTMYDAYRRRAKRYGVLFDLNLDQFYELTAAPCNYCGTAPRDGSVFLHNGIDRLDSALGYTPENTVPCCQFCNRAKMGRPASEFDQWIANLGVDSRPKGWVALDRIVDGFGQDVPIEKAIKYGWVSCDYATNKPVEEIGSPNLFLDQGRQLLAYAFGFRAPIENYTCQRYGVGTGTTAARVTDVALEAPVDLISSQATTAPITSVDFLTAFVMRVGFSIGLGDANGYLLTEFGLFSGNNTLLARKVRGVGINKTSDFSPALTWRIRF